MTPPTPEKRETTMERMTDEEFETCAAIALSIAGGPKLGAAAAAALMESRRATVDERMVKFGVKRDRAEVLGVAALVFATVARQLGITEAAVMTQVFRARQKLKSMLEGEEREAEIYGLP